MKVVLSLTILLIAVASFAQSPFPSAPDYEKIAVKIQDTVSNLYYPELFKRYLDADSSLSTEEKRHLYYGYTFQDGYAPYDRNEYNDSIKGLLSKKSLKQSDYDKLLRYTDSVLAKDPFNFDAINYRLYIFDELGQEIEYRKSHIRGSVIVESILSSGDGLSMETAFYVINTSDEYSMLNVLGYRFGGMQSLTGDCDLLKLAENEDGPKELYFNVTPCLKHLNLMFDK